MQIHIEIDAEEVLQMELEERNVFFEKIVDSSSQGFHRFIVNRELAKRLKNFVDLSPKVRGHMEYLLEMNRYQSIAKSELKIDYLEIRYGNYRPKKFGRQKWVVGHNEIVKGDFLNESLLLVENENSDGTLYEIILKNEMRLNPKRIKHLHYKIAGGDGNEIGSKFYQFNKEKRIACCICDSDKLAPHDACGDTFIYAERQIHDTMNFNVESNFLGLCLHTPCHESENFLNLETISYLIEPNEYIELENEKIMYKSEIIEKLKKIVKNQGKTEEVIDGDCLWLYYDIKNGIIGAKLGTLDDKVKNWLKLKYNKRNLEEIEVHKIGGNLLSKLSNNPQAQSAFFQHMRSAYWDKHFSNWMDKFICYLYGQQKFRL